MKVENEFKVGKNKITYVGQNFQDWFYGEGFKPSKTKLKHKVSERAMLDSEILKEWSPEPVLLGEILNAIKTNKDLLTNSYANIFYAKDTKNVLRAVFVRWVDGGWRVSAYALGDGRWYGGSQVFSRNFLSGTLSPKPLDPLEKRISAIEKTVEKITKIINIK